MKEMDHRHAVKMHAPERYLLEELSPEERAEFEEHYFACVECADEVRAAFKFGDNAKAVLAENPIPLAVQARERPRQRSGLWAWLRPAFAVPAMAVLLLGVTLYQSFLVIPNLERSLANATAPRVIPSIAAKPAVRGDETPVVISSQDPFVEVFLDINTVPPVSSYLCDVYDGSGTLRFAVPAQAGSIAGTIDLLLPATGLQSGRYTVKLIPNGAASKSSVSDSYSFVIQRK